MIGYPQPGKMKSRVLVEAFVGAAGGVCVQHAHTHAGGAAVFYGVLGIEHLLRQAQRSHTWYYGDNSYFNKTREVYYRFTLNAYQPATMQAADYARLAAQHIRIAPWAGAGGHVVVVEQSEHFMGLVGAHGWLERTLGALRKSTDRPLRVRRWSRDKRAASRSLAHDLVGAHALVAHMSAAANEALLAGVPVFVTGQCAASPLACDDVSQIEHPMYPDNREEWAAGLAGAQWTIDEIRSGLAWRRLHG